MDKLKEIPKVGDTILVSAFPGTGKSHYVNYGEGSLYMPQGFACDSDSSLFDKNHFPDNYLSHIKTRIVEGYSRVFISSHRDVREALVLNNLPFVLIYPAKDLKDEYIQRYKARGNDEKFVSLMDSNWNPWIDELQCQQGCYHIILKSNQFLSNVI